MNRAEPLNFCRSLIAYSEHLKGFASQYQNYPSDADAAQHRKHSLSVELVANMALAAQKFSLPDGGRVLLDESLKGIDEHLPLRLPFPLIALEYLATRDNFAPGMGEPCRRRIVFATETVSGIAVLPVIRFDGDERWIPMGVCRIPTTNYISRRVGGSAQIRTHFPGDYPNVDYEDELSTLLSFLNALQCSNVHIERTPARKTSKKCKNALPFDAYHQLVIDVPRSSNNTSTTTSHGERRAAREHLRRGHIVRPKGKRPYWRNATVVNAGMKSRVSKDYAVRAAP